MAKKYVADLTGFRAQDARKPGAFLETALASSATGGASPVSPSLGYLRAKSRLAAVALRNASAGAVPRTPFTRKGYASSVKRRSR